MSTTPLELPNELQQRAANAAQELGVTPHAFMVDAIRRAVGAVELRSQFVAQALSAWTGMLESGLAYDVQDVRSYLRKRVIGQQVEPPVANSWRK